MFHFVYTSSKVSHTEHKLYYPYPHLHSLDCHPLLHIALHNPLGWARPYKTYLISVLHLLLLLPLAAFTKQFELWVPPPLLLGLLLLGNFTCLLRSFRRLMSYDFNYGKLKTLSRSLWTRSDHHVILINFSYFSHRFLHNYSIPVHPIDTIHSAGLIYAFKAHAYGRIISERTKRPKLPNHTKFAFFPST